MFPPPKPTTSHASAPRPAVEPPRQPLPQPSGARSATVDDVLADPLGTADHLNGRHSEAVRNFVKLVEVANEDRDAKVVSTLQSIADTARDSGYGKLGELRSAEVLAKELAYRPMDRMDVELPVVLTHGDDTAVANYRVTKRFPLFAGAPGFALEAEGAPPILVIRGTWSWGSLALALHQEGPAGDLANHGYDGLHPLRAVRGWLAEQTRPAVIIGHSLGGSIAQILAADSPHFVDRAYAFNAPGVPRKSAERWFATPEANRPPVTVLNSDKDKLTTCGDAIGRHVRICVAEKPVEGLLANLKQHHNRLLLSHGKGVALIDKGEVTGKTDAGLLSTFQGTTAASVMRCVASWIHEDKNTDTPCSVM